MKRSALGVLTFLAGSLSLAAQTAALTTATIDSAGGKSTSGAVSHDGSLDSFGGVATSGATTTAKHGYIAQLYDAVGVAVTADASTVPEEDSVQFSAQVVMDDATRLGLDPSGVGWSIVLGPLTGIDTAGLASTDIVYQDTIAIVQGDYFAFSATGDLTILDSDPDNFEDYGNDGLTDAWQVEFYGLPPNANAAPFANPDGDAFNNLFEFGYGTNPTTADSGPVRDVDIPGGTYIPGSPIPEIAYSPLRVTYRFSRRVDFAAIGLGYTPRFSHDLDLFFNSTDTPTVLIPDSGTGYELVEIPYPIFLPNGRKGQFSQLQLSLP